MPSARPWLAVVLGLAFVAGPAAAQTAIDESLSKRDAKRLDNMEKVVGEMRAIVFKGRDTGKPVVVEPADTDSRLSELTNRVSDLETTMTRLNASLDTATHELDESRKANADLRAEIKALTDRLAAAEQKITAAQPSASPAADAGPGPAAAAAGPPQPSAADAFAHARQLMLSGSYDEAEAAFRAYVQAYPDAPKTPEARYWWGKTLAVKGAHAEAATAYIGAIRDWPQTGWAPDATVELARELVAVKKTEAACQALGEVHKHYPKASAAVKAKAAAVAAQAKCH